MLEALFPENVDVFCIRDIGPGGSINIELYVYKNMGYISLY